VERRVVLLNGKAIGPHVDNSCVLLSVTTMMTIEIFISSSYRETVHVSSVKLRFLLSFYSLYGLGMRVAMVSNAGQLAEARGTHEKVDCGETVVDWYNDK